VNSSWLEAATHSNRAISQLCAAGHRIIEEEIINIEKSNILFRSSL